MATRYCALCERLVDGRRHFGFATLALSVLTGGAWFFVLPFYRKRCPICRSVVGKRALAAPAVVLPRRSGAPPAPSPRPAPRVTRERVVAHLSELFSRDEISLSEFEERVTAAYAASTPDALAALAPGLRPALGAPARSPAPRSRRPRAAAGGVPAPRAAHAGSTRVTAVLGSVQKADLDTVPRHVEVRSMVGSVELDLRRASFAPGSTEIEVNAVAGNVELRLPSHVQVENREKGLLSSLELKEGPTASSAGSGTRVLITGRLVLSSVTVTRET
jgi:hypothetical protein